jgi:hypothetical protein
MAKRRVPDHVRADQGNELTVRPPRELLAKVGLKTLSIEPGIPCENRSVEPPQRQAAERAAERQDPPHAGQGTRQDRALASTATACARASPLGTARRHRRRSRLGRPPLRSGTLIVDRSAPRVRSCRSTPRDLRRPETPKAVRGLIRPGVLGLRQLRQRGFASACATEGVIRATADVVPSGRGNVLRVECRQRRIVAFRRIGPGHPAGPELGESSCPPSVPSLTSPLAPRSCPARSLPRARRRI